MRNLPSASVLSQPNEILRPEYSMLTFAPARGLPESSFTIPLIAPPFAMLACKGFDRLVPASNTRP